MLTWPVIHILRIVASDDHADLALPLARPALEQACRERLVLVGPTGHHLSDRGRAVLDAAGRGANHSRDTRPGGPL